MDLVKDIKFSYKINPNRNDIWSRFHEKYKCKIVYKNKQYLFDYQCNSKDTPNVLDCLYCLLSDYDAYCNTNSIEEFANEFGYDLEDYYDMLYEIETYGKSSIKPKICKIYKALEKNSHNILRLFSQEEIEEIWKYLEKENYGVL